MLFRTSNDNIVYWLLCESKLHAVEPQVIVCSTAITTAVASEAKLLKDLCSFLTPRSGPSLY